MLNIDKDKVTGCLLGGAVGDALGAPVEFLSILEIRRQFGEAGVQGYVEYPGGKGAFTDDTQMTLFTAEGILRAHHRGMLRGIGGALLAVVYQSYLRWLHTQGGRPVSVPDGWGVYDLEGGWLIREKGLFARRAPGNTCLEALRSGRAGTIADPINDSKGCGGIMRVAPAGLSFNEEPERAFRLAAEMAALTHGHPSGYLSAGYLGGLLAYIAQGLALVPAIEQTNAILKTWDGHEECERAVENTLAHYRTKSPTPENIEQLGGAWVGEETLAISLFCALHYQDDFRGGVLAAVNHSGDCDSTAAVAGNILGLLLGKHSIPAEWIENLELAGVVEAIAIDLHTEVKGDTDEPDQGWWVRYPGY